jgi:fluoride exporter
MNSLLAVFIGGGLGSLARYGVNNLFASVSLFPVAAGTLVSNIIASFILGIYLGLSATTEPIGTGWRFLIAAGFCGGFSTFSAFSAETFELIRHGQFIGGFLNITANLVLGIGALALGWWLSK